MKSYIKELIVLLVLFLILFNTIQHFEAIYSKAMTSRWWKVYSVGSFFAAGLLIYLILRSATKNGVVSKLATVFMSLSIPRGLKLAIVIVFIGNMIAIGLAKPCYPFYDVGMFRWSSRLSNPSKIVYNPQYYYYQNNELHILELRKEGFTFLADHFKQGYTHEFAFAAAFHNKGQKENFEFIAQVMKERGVDTLWVGVHSVNYATGEVRFDPDLCNAVIINQTQKIHYGPIYIPDYQKQKCPDGN